MTDNGLYRNIRKLAGEDMMFKEIIGRQINHAILGQDTYSDGSYKGEGTKLTFKTNVGDYVYTAYSDCCSESWIESTDPMVELFGATVNRIEQSETQSADGTRQEYDKVDFVTLVTDKGHWKLEFRNSSNGYYGGSMELISLPEGKRR